MQILAAAKAALYEFSLTDLTGVIAYNPKHFYAFNNTFYPHRTRNALSFQTQSYEGDLQWSHVGKYAYDNISPTHSFCYPSYMPFLFCLPSLLLVGLPKKREEKKNHNKKYWAIKKKQNAQLWFLDLWTCTKKFVFSLNEAYLWSHSLSILLYTLQMKPEWMNATRCLRFVRFSQEALLLKSWLSTTGRLMLQLQEFINAREPRNH